MKYVCDVCGWEYDEEKGEVSTSVSGQCQQIGKPLVSTHLSRQGGDQRHQENEYVVIEEIY